MRLFVAVELSEEARKHLVRVQRRLEALEERAGYVGEEGLRWVAPESLHVTVKFLGDVKESELQPLTGELSRVAFSGASLVADHLICLPPKGPVWVAAAGLGGQSDALERLNLMLENACEPLGFPRERRPYLPHITIGRRRRGRASPAVRSRGDYIADAERVWPGPPFRAESFVLMQSELRPEGSAYTPVARFPPST